MDASAHCDALLRGRDEDRWLAARYAPPPLRRRLVALYAFHSELRLIPSRVSEPALGEIRVQWHRDALAEIRDGKNPRAHPIIEEVAAAGLAGQAYAHWIDAAIDAAARPLYGEGFVDADDLFGWLRAADGAVDAVAIALCGGDENLSHVAQEAGAAFAAAREARVLAPNIAWSQPAAALWRKAKPVLALAPDKCAPALAHLYLTPTYIKRDAAGKSDNGAFPLLKRLRLLAAIAVGR